MTGLSHDRTDAIVIRLVELGLLNVPEQYRGLFVPAPVAEPGIASDVIDLDAAIRQQIDELYCQLGTLDYFTLLGIDGNAGARDIKKAYFLLSKKFHPDRFFGKRLGPYQLKLNRIFTTIKAAYDLLGDDDLRGQYLRQLAASRKELLDARRQEILAQRRKKLFNS